MLLLVIGAFMIYLLKYMHDILERKDLDTLYSW